jgi:para-aminobenzoate synthetase/4-amino-4-deoxychorismate lyase
VPLTEFPNILCRMVHVIFGRMNAPAARDDWHLSSDSPSRILRATQIPEVIPLLRSVAEATAAGAWAVVMLAYEAAPSFDSALKTHPPNDFPLACAAIFRDPGRRIAQDGTGHYSLSPWRPLIDRRVYEDSVEKIRDLIARGHTYQVNYAFPSVCDFEGDSLAWYRDLCASQDAGYSAYLDLGRYQVLCLSPELFFKRQGNRITTRPMKGTSKRGRWLAEDQELASRLYQSEKDRAENVMIVDLLRNDLGKISVPGSVQVTRLFELERYETLWQMTSTIDSEANPQTGLAELLGALFPCGSITGAPKVRTMEIIRELEPFPRHIFTGTIGLVRPGGDCCFNVAIRTVVLDSSTGRATFGVGGGITFGSTAKGEYEECLVKTAFLTREPREFQLIESMLLEQGEFFLLERHLARLGESCAYFGFEFNEEKVLAALRHAAQTRHTGCWKVRLLQSKDGAFELDFAVLPSVRGRGVPPLMTRRTWQGHPAPDDSKLARGSRAGRPCHIDEPRRVKLSSAPIDSNDRFLFHKTTNRLRYDEALASVSGCNDVILWNERSEVTESSIANLVVRIGGQLCTPPLESGLLGGTFRSELLHEGTIHERLILKQELEAARSFYLINSVRKWMPAVLEE